MRLLILFFSGTGNTHYVSGYLARKLEHLPIEIVVRSIEQVPAEAVPEFDLIAVYPPVSPGGHPDRAGHGGEVPLAGAWGRLQAVAAVRPSDGGK